MLERSMSSTRSHSSAARVSTVPIVGIAALFTIMSMPPSASQARSTIAATDSTSPTSAAKPTAVPPWARIASACLSAPAPFRSAIATVAPSAAKRSAVAAPMPEAPPVTSARLPAKRINAYSMGSRSGAWSGGENHSREDEVTDAAVETARASYVRPDRRMRAGAHMSRLRHCESAPPQPRTGSCQLH